MKKRQSRKQQRGGGEAELGILEVSIKVEGKKVELNKLNPNDPTYRRLIRLIDDKFTNTSFSDYTIADIDDEGEIQRAPPFATSDQVRAFMEKNQPGPGQSHILVYRSTGETDTPEYDIELPDTMRFNDYALGEVRITFSRFIRIEKPEDDVSSKGKTAATGVGAAAAAAPSRSAGPAAAAWPVGAGAGPAPPAAAPAPAAAATGDPENEDEEDPESGKKTPRGDKDIAGGKKRLSKTKKHKRNTKMRITRRR